MRILVAALLLSQVAVAQAPDVAPPGQKRDPFANLTRLLPPPTECTHSFCKFALSDLRLLAIVTGDSNPVAMFEDPQHNAFIVRRHSQIGQAAGRVSDISRRCVTVTEQMHSSDGRTSPNKVRVCLEDEVLIAHDLGTDRLISFP